MAHRGRHASGNTISPPGTSTSGAGEPAGAETDGAHEANANEANEEGPRSLRALSSAAHADIARLVDVSQHEQQVAGDPRRALLATDAAVAAVSAHLAVMEVTLYPEIASRLPNGKARMHKLRHQARDVDSVARGIEQMIYGDVHRPIVTIASLRDELADHVAVHAHAEDVLVAELEQELSDSERERLAKKIAARTRHAPTRPHPRLHFPTRAANRLAMNVAGRWDHVLDTMDARSAAGTPVRAPAPPGLWGWYLLGRPTAPETETTATEVDQSAGDARRDEYQHDDDYQRGDYQSEA